MADWKGKTHFFAVGANANRRLLIDPARQRARRLFQHVQSAFPEFASAFDVVFIGAETSTDMGFREDFMFDLPAEKHGS